MIPTHQPTQPFLKLWVANGHHGGDQREGPESFFQTCSYFVIVDDILYYYMVQMFHKMSY